MQKIIVSGLIVGVIAFVISMALSQGLNLLLPPLGEEYQNPNLFRPWTDPLMMLFFAYPFILGQVLALAWHKTKNNFSGEGINKGLKFGLFYWLISGLPGMFVSWTSFQVSTLMVLSWVLLGLVEALVAGVVLAKVNR